MKQTLHLYIAAYFLYTRAKQPSVMFRYTWCFVFSHQVPSVLSCVTACSCFWLYLYSVAVRLIIITVLWGVEFCHFLSPACRR